MYEIGDDEHRTLSLHDNACVGRENTYSGAQGLKAFVLIAGEAGLAASEGLLKTAVCFMCEQGLLIFSSAWFCSLLSSFPRTRKTTTAVAYM